MKTIQALARYFPDKCGGIQVNLKELALLLQSQGIEVKIASAQNGSKKEDIYEYSGVEVYRYPVFPTPKPEPNHGQFPHGGFKYFANWLLSQKAQIYHQHHFESTCGLPHLRFAKQLGMATVVTIHYAVPLCHRHTLMLYGQEACNSKIDVIRCSHCTDTLSRKLPDGMVKTLSHIPMPIVGRLPLPVSAYLPTSVDNKAKGRFVRPLVIPAYIAARQHSLLEMAKYADRIVAVCDWLYKALLINGIPEEKLVLSRCGVSYGVTEIASQKIDSYQQQQPRSLRVAFLGRWDVAKGVHVIVEAVKDLPQEIKIELVIHGIAHNEPYRKQIMELIGNDARIRVCQQLSREELSSVANYDLLAVPSQGFETGPLVVLEAHAMGVPVIGSDLGGIAELVTHGIDGWLVPADDTKAWTEALWQLSTNTNLLNQLRSGIKPVRTVSKQAAEVAEIYRHLHQRSKNTCTLE